MLPLEGSLMYLPQTGSSTYIMEFFDIQVMTEALMHMARKLKYTATCYLTSAFQKHTFTFTSSVAMHLCSVNTSYSITKSAFQLFTCLHGSP